EDSTQWRCSRLAPQGGRAMPEVSDDGCQREPMTGIIATDDDNQRKRCQEASLFRRAKDSSKEKERYKDRTPAKTDDRRQRFQNGAFSEHHPAGAARPVPEKYDSLS